jgi:hypothetical protein
MHKFETLLELYSYSPRYAGQLVYCSEHKTWVAATNSPSGRYLSWAIPAVRVS